MGKLFREFTPEKLEQVRTDPYFAGIVKSVLKKAEDCINTEPPIVKYSQIHLYETTGNREIFQRVHSNYELRMRYYFLAYLLTEDEKYIEPLADIIWNICDFETWTIPAHVREDRPLQLRREFLDLTSTILGFAIAEILYYIGDKLPELVRRRAEHEVRERVIESYKKHDANTFWWMKCDNNWASVCIGATLCAFLYLASDEEIKDQLPRMMATADGYLRGFDDDGCCKEGYGYWCYGFSYYLIFASMLRDYTDGEIDLFKNPKVHQIALFQQNVPINDREVISFSDAGGTFNPPSWISHFLKNEYPDIEIPSFKNLTNAASTLRDIFWLRPEFADCKMNPKSHIYHDNQWFIYRSPGYNFACKAGKNNEPHNHNDIGSFIISKNGRTTFTDPGGGEYTRQYFSSERYNLTACSSKGHSVPIINGRYQVTGNVKSTVFTEKENEYAFSMENGYAEPTLNGLKREFKCEADEIILTDTYEFSEKPESVTERFVSLLPIEITDDGAKCGDTLLVYDKELCDVTLKEDSIFRSGHKEQTVYIIDFSIKAPTQSFEIKFNFR